MPAPDVQFFDVALRDAAPESLDAPRPDAGASAADQTSPDAVPRDAATESLDAHAFVPVRDASPALSDIGPSDALFPDVAPDGVPEDIGVPDAWDLPPWEPAPADCFPPDSPESWQACMPDPLYERSEFCVDGAPIVLVLSDPQALHGTFGFGGRGFEAAAAEAPVGPPAGAWSPCPPPDGEFPPSQPLDALPADALADIACFPDDGGSGCWEWALGFLGGERDDVPRLYRGGPEGNATATYLVVDLEGTARAAIDLCNGVFFIVQHRASDGAARLEVHSLHSGLSFWGDREIWVSSAEGRPLEHRVETLDGTLARSNMTWYADGRMASARRVVEGAVGRSTCSHSDGCDLDDANRVVRSASDTRMSWDGPLYHDTIESQRMRDEAGRVIHAAETTVAVDGEIEWARAYQVDVTYDGAGAVSRFDGLSCFP